MSGLSTSLLLAGAAVLQMKQNPNTALQRDAALAGACLARSGPSGQRLLQLVDTRWGRGVLKALERLLLPGITDHYAWRKRHLRRWALQACDARIRQVIILGAGFDGLGLALLEHRHDVRVFEFERAGTIEIKRAALHALDLDDPRLSLSAIDLLTATLPAQLSALPGFAPDAPTLVIAEGVLMYLPADQVARLLQGLSRVLTHGRLIATAMSRRPDGQPGFHREHCLVRWWLQRRGETFQWGANAYELAELLRTGQVELRHLADPAHRDDPDPSPGEWVFAGTLLAGPAP